jgi:hypothetical protein
MVKTLPAANKDANVPYNLFNNLREANREIERPSVDDEVK